MSLISLKLFLFLMLFNVNHSQNIVSTAITKENRVNIGGRNYHFGQFEMMGWSEANNRCIALSMQLASFETQSEYEAVMNYILDHPEYDFWMWLSGHRNGDTGGLEKPWVWGSSGTTIGYTAWTEGEPDEAYTSPACMNFSATAGGWEDDLCDLVISFLCEAP